MSTSSTSVAIERRQSSPPKCPITVRIWLDGYNGNGMILPMTTKRPLSVCQPPKGLALERDKSTSSSSESLPYSLCWHPSVATRTSNSTSYSDYRKHSCVFRAAMMWECDM